MRERKEIIKVGLAAFVDRKLVLVRKKGNRAFILPGGKPESGESHLDALIREVEEELGCSIQSPIYHGRFADKAAELRNTDVVVLLYCGKLVGQPMPRSEIEEIALVDVIGSANVVIAPSIKNHILPYLRTLITSPAK